MTDHDQIKAAWENAPPWNFAKQGVLRMPAWHEPPARPTVSEEAGLSSPVADIIEFEMQFKGGVRSAIRIVGRLRDTEITVHHERH